MVYQPGWLAVVPLPTGSWSLPCWERTAYELVLECEEYMSDGRGSHTCPGGVLRRACPPLPLMWALVQVPLHPQTGSKGVAALLRRGRAPQARN